MVASLPLALGTLALGPALLGEMADRSCAETVARIVAEVRGFESTRGASDDVTLIVARRTG